jgi:multidrug resistance efflux pump
MKKESKRILIPLIIFAAVLGGLYLYYTEKNRSTPSIRVTGIMDGYEVNIAPKVAGRISWECCSEGNTVKEGQIAIRLDSEDIRASVVQAEAGVEKANADIRSSEAAIRNAEANMKSAEADAKSAQADIEKAFTQMEESGKEAERAKALYKREYISKESRDQSVAAYDVNVAAHKATEEQLNAANEKRNAAEAQLHASVSQLNSSKAMLREAAANLAYHRTKLDDTVIKSPVTGTVIFKSLEAGETVSPGVTIMTVVDLGGLYARVDIDETKVGGVVLNSPALVRVDGMPGKVFRGKVSEIGRYAEFATQRDVVRGREDIKTFRVKVKVEDTSGLLKPGMTVEVEIPRKT